MGVSQRQYSTGLHFLDRRIGGGLEAGSLLAYTAPPESQSELLLREFLMANPTYYVSTTRPTDEVREWATATRSAEPELTVRHIAPDNLLDGVDELRADFEPESFLIIDSINAIEMASRESYLAFLNDLKELLRRTDSVGVLHCLDLPQNPPRRGLTLHRADQVWQLQVLSLSQEIKNKLLITKARNSRALSQPIDLLLTDRVRVDTSRTI